ncbi:MAG TPA: SMP-30/gluconolactonase/LRE family protein [Sphingobium sp.]|uniref:SMP-30/gluconolactonase/LRE family protein n=1 Tax=Sphingobium sp. TaxID=1912891 RepID=UPI002ED61155
MATEASVEVIARGFYLEGLLVDGDAIWYTDVAVGGVQLVGSDRVLLPERTMIGGLLLNDDGSVLVAGDDGIAWAHPDGRSGMLVEGLGGANEMRSDGRGGMYFGTIDLAAILKGERPGPSTIQHLSISGELRQVRGGLSFANGLSLSPDGRSLYFNESFSASRVFPVEADGFLGDPRLLADKYDCDGMALDAEGHIWITGFSSGELLCLRPDGSEVRRVTLPGEACTNVRFGGPDLRDLYVTMVDPASAQALAEGRPLEEQNSTLYRLRSPVPGAPMAPTRFRL